MSGNQNKKRFDENYEKPSKHKQWQERSERPIAVQSMSKEQIEELRRNLIASYQCEDNEITYDFQKITDKDDEDRDDCLWIKYKLKCIRNGKPTTAEIFTIKLPIPDSIKKAAEDLKKTQMSAQVRPAQLQITNGIMPAPVVTNPPVDPEPVATRPKLRRPVTRGKK